MSALQVDGTTVSRRALVGGTAASLAMFALATTESGSRVAYADENGMTWDYEADLVVVGGGGAGFCAGIEAAEAGSTVLVIEKNSWCGGNSYMCGGHILAAGTEVQKEVWGETDDSGEVFAEDMIRWSQGLADEDMIREMCLKSNEEIEWMASLGRELPVAGVLPPIWCLDDGRPYYHRSLQGPEGETQYGVHFPPLEQKLLSYPEDQVRVVTETAATHLIQNEDGRVIGVEAEGPDGTVYAKARKGVVLSAAGIDHDLDMAKRFSHQQYWGLRMLEEGLTHPLTFDTVANTGDGVRMGMEVGADLAISSACCQPDLHYIGGVDEYDSATGHESNPYHSMKFEGNILVNPLGRRYVQEDAVWGYVIHMSVEELIKCGANLGSLDKHNHIICDADHFWVWENKGFAIADNEDGTVTADVYGNPLPSYICRADTLEELAEKIGVPADNLVRTVEEWNSYCDDEHDPDFDRRVDFGKIQTPPFYADIIRPDVLGSFAGLKCDIETRVLDVNGDPIPGLYSAGTNMGGNWVGAFYPGCGWAILGTIVWGRKAGVNVAAEQPWD